MRVKTQPVSGGGKNYRQGVMNSIWKWEDPDGSRVFVNTLGIRPFLQDHQSVLAIPHYALYVNLFQQEELSAFSWIQAVEASVIFKTKTANFYFALSGYPELAQEILAVLSGKNVTKHKSTA